MSEMLERAADAIVEAGYNPATAADIAEIVIKAMREPTQEMSLAYRQMDTFSENYQHMIDAALK